jgi:hypothetical protein
MVHLDQLDYEKGGRLLLGLREQEADLEVRLVRPAGEAPADEASA